MLLPPATLSDLLEQSSGSGSGLPLFVSFFNISPLYFRFINLNNVRKNMVMAEVRKYSLNFSAVRGLWIEY